MTKICLDCKKEKDNDLFAKDSKHTNGTKNICKECAAKQAARHREKYQNDEAYRIKARERARAYRASHKEAVMAKKRQWSQTAKAKEYQKKYNQRPENRYRYQRLQWKRKYGLEPLEADKMLKAQDYRCAICGCELLKPFVDHCHETNKVRGFLCTQCNVGLGYFRDNTDFLHSAVRYLESNGKVV
jgi:16S rRNA C967 or C1407 C5-methylase (RsmB/RsmF family)